MARVGSALTGQDDETDKPTRSIFGSVGDTLNQKVFDDPASRAALLQIGLNLMQPVAMGQSVGGHIAQGIGAGGEEVTREEERQRKADQAEEELDLKRRAATTKERETDIYGKYIDTKGTTDALTLAQFKANAAAGLQGNKNHHQAAIETFSAMQNALKEAQKQLLVDPDAVKNLQNTPLFQKYGNKDINEIEQQLRATDPTAAATAPPTSGGGGGAVPPPEKRVPGQVYQTPKGPMKWIKDGNSFGWTTP